MRVSGEKIKSGFGVFFVFAFFVLIEGSSNRLGTERLGCETNDENTFSLSLDFMLPLCLAFTLPEKKCTERTQPDVARPQPAHYAEYIPGQAEP